MERILTQPSISNLQHSNINKRKKLILMKVFHNSHRNDFLNSTERHRISTQINDEVINKKIIKTQRCQTKQNSNQITSNLPQIIFKTLKSKNSPKRQNIFKNQYIKCLKKGFFNPYEQSNKILNKNLQNNDFQGPVYNSQIYTEPVQNPQYVSPIVEEEQMYKFDRNLKSIKFKVSLKRQSLNLSHQQKQSQKLQPYKKSISKILITQSKTQDSKISYSDASSMKRFQSIPKRFNPMQQLSQVKNYQVNLLNSKSIRIPRLSQNSNLYKSIKLFERKTSLLGQIESSKGIQQKYGTRMFQYLVRNRYHQNERKNDFIMKVKYNKKNNEPQQMIRNKFIRDIQSGKYNTNYKYKQRQLPFKIKGRTQTVPTNIQTHQI